MAKKTQPKKDMTAAEFLAYDGASCPYCGGAASGDSDTQFEGDAVAVGAHCLECGHSWDEEYRLVGYSYVENGQAVEHIDSTFACRIELLAALRDLKEYVLTMSVCEHVDHVEHSRRLEAAMAVIAKASLEI